MRGWDGTGFLISTTRVTVFYQGAPWLVDVPMRDFANQQGPRCVWLENWAENLGGMRIGCRECWTVRWRRPMIANDNAGFSSRDSSLDPWLLQLLASAVFPAASLTRGRCVLRLQRCFCATASAYQHSAYTPRLGWGFHGRHDHHDRFYLVYLAPFVYSGA